MTKNSYKIAIICFSLWLIMTSLVIAENTEQNEHSTEQRNSDLQQPDIQNNDVKLFIDKIEIEGRLEKPQVMLFLQGQTPEIDDIQIERSFMKDIFRPVEQRITVETKFRTEYTKNKKSVIEW